METTSGTTRGIEIAFIVILIIGILSGKGRGIDNVNVVSNPVSYAARQVDLSYDEQMYDSSTGYRFYSSDYSRYGQYTDPRVGYQFYADDAREYAPSYIR